LDIDISHKPISFDNIHSFLLGELRKYFSLQVAPKGVRIFHSGISVSLLNLLYTCPIFLSNLVLFLLHSDGADPFLFLPFGYLLSFFIVESIFCGSFNAETLASSNEELFYFRNFLVKNPH